MVMSIQVWQRSKMTEQQVHYVNERLEYCLLYGLLKPLDLMLPLSLGNGHKTKKSQEAIICINFGDTIADLINQRMAENKTSFSKSGFQTNTLSRSQKNQRGYYHAPF